jgi:hypothetical protein
MIAMIEVMLMLSRTSARACVFNKSFVHWVVDQGDDVNELPSRREVINLVDDRTTTRHLCWWLQNHEAKCTK